MTVLEWSNDTLTVGPGFIVVVIAAIFLAAVIASLKSQ